MILHTYVLRVQYSCGVVLVFWFWREMVFGVSIYCLTVTIVSQKYRELSLQVEIVVGRLDMYRTKVLLYRTMVLLARPTKVRC